MADPQFLSLSENVQLAYHKHEGDLSKPGVIFLGGLMSDMTGSKATHLEAYCHQEKLSFIRFDYKGHGQSSGEFTEGSIGTWLSDAQAILDQVANPDQKYILIGSSMGGWIMLLLALANPNRVHALLGIAAAPDFPTKLMWDQLPKEQQQELVEKGIIHLPSDYSDDPYPIRHAFIEESRQHNLLDGKIDITCPVRLLHGMRDEDVPYQFSLDIAHKMTSDDVDVLFIKSGDHRLSSEENLCTLTHVLEELLMT